VNRDFSIDLDDLADRIGEHTRGIIVTHYFGFPQEMAEVKRLCARSGLLLIEDCAHALYSRSHSGHLLGTIGDFGIFSLYKIIALPNGGGLLVNNTGGALPPRGRKYFELSMVKSMIRSALEFETVRKGVGGLLAGWFLSMSRRSFSRTSGGSLAPNRERSDRRWYYDTAPQGYEHDISSLSMPFVGREAMERIVTLRRSNYQILEAKLADSGHENLRVPRLPDLCCPLCLPVAVPGRDKVWERMRARGVEPFVFGRFAHPLLDWDAFPDARFLADNLIGLPVQQQLASGHMQIIADAFRASLIGTSG
jgi:dTDP-4-amino-4,6-dideoxygalactose transaminase